MKFEFAAPSSLDTDNRSANTARLLNMYREPAGDGAIWCKSLLGMKLFANTGKVFCRAMAEVAGRIFVAQGGFLFRLSAAGSVQNLGAINDDESTTISSNNGLVTIVAGGAYYVWDGTTLTQPETGAFSDFGDVTFFGQLTILTERNGRRVQWSGVADPMTLDGLAFATTEARDDNILRVIPVGAALWFLKQTSIEPWYQSGADIAAVPGATIDRGLKSRSLAVQIPSGVFFVGDDGRAYVGGGSIEGVSNPAVETSIAQDEAIRTFYFEDEGHKFCAIVFRGRPSWVYNLATNEWCERSEGNLFGPWTARASVKSDGVFYVGTETGAIATLERVNSDFGMTMPRRIISRTVENEGRRFTLSGVQVVTRAGFFDIAPQIYMRMSKDFGMTWGADRQKSLGERGEYLTRTVFRRLGQYRQATMEITVSDPVDVNVKSEVYT